MYIYILYARVLMTWVSSERLDRSVTLSKSWGTWLHRLHMFSSDAHAVHFQLVQ